MNSEEKMEAQSENSARRFMAISILLGAISITPLVISVVGTAIEGILHVMFLGLHYFLSWLGDTNLVVYLGWLGLPGLITGIMAFKAAETGRQKGAAVIGVILGVQGIAWTILISSAIRLVRYL